VLQERPETVSTLAPGPEDAYEQQESPESVTDATHSDDSRNGRRSVKSSTPSVRTIAFMYRRPLFRRPQRGPSARSSSVSIRGGAGPHRVAWASPASDLARAFRLLLLATRGESEGE
jgi:hypothetical protein